MAKTQQQLRLVDLVEKRVQLKRRLRAARTALRLAVKASSEGVPKRGRTKTRDKETPEIQEMARHLQCLHAQIYACRRQVLNPEKRRLQRKAWYARNKERLHPQQQARYQRNRERILASQSAHDKAKRAQRSADPEVQAARRRRKEENKEARGKAISQGLLRSFEGRVRLCTPERKKLWQKTYMSKPGNAEKKRAYAQRPEVKERRNARTRERDKLRWKTDPQFALSSLLRCRVRGALTGKGLTKRHRTEVLIGCTVEAFKTHIEANFLPGMTWDNRGDWHIDHKLPCASFDLTDVAQQLVCFHYTNMQPLWKLDNLRKGVSLPELAESKKEFDAVLAGERELPTP